MTRRVLSHLQRAAHDVANPKVIIPAEHTYPVGSSEYFILRKTKYTGRDEGEKTIRDVSEPFFGWFLFGRKRS